MGESSSEGRVADAAAAAGRPRVVAGLRLVRLVGRGGEGEVWEARTGDGQARALKLIRPDALVEPAEVGRRGRWLRAVDHPALVAVRRTGVLAGGGLDGWAFVEMPFLDGPSMEGAAADPEVLERLEPLADALDALHAGVWSRGVPLVHRDVKPANLIDVGDHLVLVDHSTLRDASAETVTRIGTPVFAAPEVPLGRAGPSADVYSFAATAVALLSGARGGALAALLDEPDGLDVPSGLRAALATDPRDRPASCREALEDDPFALPFADGAAAERRPHRAPGQPETAPPIPPLGPLEPEPHASLAGRLPVWRWFGVLALITLLPLGALGAGLPVWPDLAVVAAAAVAGHLAAHALGGGPPVLRVVLPPLAWAWLLAERTALGSRRRAYARATLTGALGATTAAVGWALGAERDPELALVAAVAGLLLVIGGVLAARRGGLLLQLGLLPAWLVGAAGLVAGAAVLTPLAPLVGRGRAAVRLLWETLASAAETLRRPVAPPRTFP